MSEEVEWGLIDHDATTDEVVAVEIWAASKRLPKAILDALPAPGRPHGVAAAMFGTFGDALMGDALRRLDDEERAEFGETIAEAWERESSV